MNTDANNTKNEKRYTAVKQKNGVTRRVPKEYRKPLGKTITVSMSLPLTIATTVTEIAESSKLSKSKVFSDLLTSALETRGKEES